MHDAVRYLGDAGVSVQWHVSPGVGHGIDPEGLELGGRFLRDAFAGVLAATASQN
jgi:phospholipase/carboxylesterase